MNENVKCIFESEEVVLLGSWGGQVDLCFKQNNQFVEYATFEVKSDVRKIVQTNPSTFLVLKNEAYFSLIQPMRG